MQKILKDPFGEFDAISIGYDQRGNLIVVRFENGLIKRSQFKPIDK